MTEHLGNRVLDFFDYRLNLVAKEKKSPHVELIEFFLRAKTRAPVVGALTGLAYHVLSGEDLTRSITAGMQYSTQLEANIFLYRMMISLFR